MFIIGGAITAIAGLSITCNHKICTGNWMFEFQFKGDRAMTGLAIIATGLMAGYGPWRGKQVESRNNVVDEFSLSYNYNNQTMGFESPIPALFD